MSRAPLWLALLFVAAAALAWSARVGAPGPHRGPAEPRLPRAKPLGEPAPSSARVPRGEPSPNRPPPGAPGHAGAEGITLTGRLMDQRGSPLDLDQVELRLAGSGGTRQVRVSGGFYESRGLAPGRLEVEVIALGYRTLRAHIELPADADLLEHNFRLEPTRWVRLEARSTDGRDLTEVLASMGLAARRSAPRFVVSARELPSPGSPMPEGGPPPPARLHPEWLVNEDRREGASLAPKAPAFAALAEWLPGVGSGEPVWVGLALGSVLVDAREVLGHEDLVVLSLEPQLLEPQLAGLFLRVVNAADGSPMANVNAWVGTADATALGQSDESGRIQLEGLLPGRVMVYLVAALGPNSLVRRPGFAEDIHWIDLEPGQSVDLGDVRLGSPARLALQMEWEGAAAPPLDLDVGLLRSVDGTRLLDPFLSRVGVGPELELELPCRQLVLIASNRELGLRSRPTLVDLTEGGTRRGKMVLERATLVELVSSAPSAPHWTYLVLDEAGVQAAAGRLDPRGTAALQLLPGSYWIHVEDQFGFERANLRCDVSSAPLRLRL